MIPVIGPIVPFIDIIVTPAFLLSMAHIYLWITNKNIDISVSDAFCGFEDFFSAFKLNLYVVLSTALWSFLLFIPGIIKSISYSMSMYILAENPGKSALECMNESEKMTEGHKMELFLLSLSFIGWHLIGVLSLGWAYIWITPYMSATYANAYLSLKAQCEPISEIPTEQIEE